LIVADASVILKWILVDEIDREKALALRRRHIRGEDPIAAPDLLLYEVANVLPMKKGNPGIALEGLKELYSAGFHLHSFDLPEFSRAVELALHHKITTYDACYLALAQALRCRFVTADEKLLAHLKGTPNILHLREAIR